MPFEEIRGRKIYYEIHGSGPTVVFLHHGFAGSRMWDYIWPDFVKAGYQVVTFDRRGYGQSEPGAGFEEFYVSDEFCADSALDMEELCRALGLGRFHVVGQCEGGVIGVEFAGMSPDRVISLVTASTMCFSSTTMTEFNAAKFPKKFDELDPDIRKKLLIFHGEGYAPTLYEMARTHGGAYGVGFFDIRPKLPLVTCPALVLYPDRSALFEVEQAVTFYRALPKGELAIIPRCGHNTYDQQPAEYSRIALNFINRNRPEQAAELMDFSMTCLAPAPKAAG